MSTYVSLAVREYGQGRICITTDRLSGILTGHGFTSIPFWRKVLEWTGSTTPEETVKVAVVESCHVGNLDYLLNFSELTYQLVDLNYITTTGLAEFDLVYFIGLPPIVSTEVADAIAQYVNDGVGVLIEVPDIGAANINVISAIDSVYCTSETRPIYVAANWSNSGLVHYVYDQGAQVYFYSTLLMESFSANWDVLMTNAPAPAPTTFISTFATPLQATSAFGISYLSSFVNGVVKLEP